MSNKSFIESTMTQEGPAKYRDLASAADSTFEIPLRPQSLDEFVGQDSVRDRLDILVGAARLRSEALGHCLFSGPPGLGKTTLANILAKLMGTNIVITSGAVIEKPGDLA